MKEFLDDLKRLKRFGFWKRIYKQMGEDDLSGLSAEMTYYLVLSLFPFLMFVTALAGLLIQNPQVVLNDVIHQMNQFLPREVVGILAGFLEGPVTTDRPGILSFGILATLWAGQKGMGAVIKAINRAYDIIDNRPWWKKTLLTAGLFILTALGAVALLGVLLGAPVASLVGSYFGLTETAVLLWSLVRWPIAVIILTLVLALVYWGSLNARQRLRWITPGGVIAMTLAIVASALISVYVENFGNYDKTYGTLGSVAILLLWLYVTSLVILIGAEVNSELAWAVEAEEGKKVVIPSGPRRKEKAEPQPEDRGTLSPQRPFPMPGTHITPHHPG